MANKKGVIMYYDLIEQLSDFNDKDFREIIIAMMEYDKTGKEPNFDGMKKIAFKFIKTTIDKNNQDYFEKCEKNRQNAMSKWGKTIIEQEDFENLTLKQKNSMLRRDRLKEANKKGTHTEEEWLEMKRFFNNICVKCGNSEDIVKDHITPIYMGGSNGLDNIQPLCRSCNSSKGADRTDYRELYCGRLNIKNPYSVCERSSSLANATDIDKDIDKDNKKERNIIKKEKSIDELISEQPEELQPVLRSFVEMRKKIKKPMTDYAFKLLLNKLEKLSNGFDGNKMLILNQSILNGWQDVYELKEVKFSDFKQELVDYAKELANGKGDKYTQAILTGWKQQGIDTVEQAKLSNDLFIKGVGNTNNDKTIIHDRKYTKEDYASLMCDIDDIDI